MIHLFLDLYRRGASLHNMVRTGYTDTPPDSGLRVMLASVFLDRMTRLKHRFIQQDGWKQVVDDVDDFANDIVKMYMYKAKPFSFGDNWASYLLVPSWDDFDTKGVI